MVECLRPASFEPGEPIYRHGQVARDICLMETGIVRAYYLHEAREVNLRLLSAPAVAASMPSPDHRAAFGRMGFGDRPGARLPW